MKKIHSTILLTMLLFVFGPKAIAHDIEVVNADGKTIYYNYINDGTELEVTYQGLEVTYVANETYSGTIVIPEEVTYNNRALKVTSIGDCAFYSSIGLYSVILPNSVTSIGVSAFSCCNDLTSVNIPYSVTSIGNSAFSSCPKLTNPLYNEHLFARLPTSYQGEYTIPSNITTICGGAFSYCRGLTSVNIPNSVTSIGAGAFSNCTILTSITIPNSVTSIEESVFNNCSSLTSVTIPNSVTSIGVGAFWDCKSLTSITIPSSVTSIGGCAFYGCKSLTSVTIPNGVTSIEGAVFKGCTSLTSVTIPNSVTSIGSAAFQDCTSLISVTIPNSVTSIGERAFYGYELQQVVSMIENPFIINGKSSGYPTFSLNSFNNATLYIPVGTIGKYRSTEGWKDFVFIEEGTGISEEIPTNVTVTIGSLGVSTFCSPYALDFSAVGGLKAYIVSAFSPGTGSAILTKVNKRLPARTGLVLMGNEGSYTVPTTEADTYVSNMLAGVTRNTPLNRETGCYTNYILANGSNGLGFYPVSDGSTLAAGKAYLPLLTVYLPATASGRISLDFDDAETTGIDDLNQDSSGKAAIYNLNGQRLRQPVKGMYIMNGKTFIKR